MISAADAPSVICEELPAVITPFGSKAGFNRASVSTVVSSRIPSSARTGLLVPSSSVDRQDLAVEAALVAGARRALLRGGRELVDLLTREVPLPGDQLRGQALGDEAPGIGVAALDPGTEGEADALPERGAHRHEAHDLDARGDHDVVHPGHDGLGGERGGLLRRTALPVDRGGRHRFREAGGEHGVAADVQALGPDLRDAAHDHVLDQGGVEVVALDEGRQHLAGQVGGVPPRQRAVAPAPRRAHHVDDHCIGHLILPSAPCGARFSPGVRRRT
jgi:hypothetical protein